MLKPTLLQHIVKCCYIDINKHHKWTLYINFVRCVTVFSLHLATKKTPNDIESLILKAASMLVFSNITFCSLIGTGETNISVRRIAHFDSIFRAIFLFLLPKAKSVPRAPLRIHIRTNGTEKYRLFVNTRKADIINELIDEANAIIHGLITVIKCHAEIQSKKHT